MNIEFATFPFLTALLLSSVGGLLVILLLPAGREKEIKWVSAVFAGISLCLSVYLFFAYDENRGGLQFAEKIIWVRSLGIHYFNGIESEYL